MMDEEAKKFSLSHVLEFAQVIGGDYVKAANFYIIVRSSIREKNKVWCHLPSATVTRRNKGHVTSAASSCWLLKCPETKTLNSLNAP